MVHQAVGHAFVSHASMMTNSVHNDVVKTLAEGTFQGYTRTSFQQPGQMNFTPVGPATITPPMTSQSQSDGSIGSTQLTNTTLPPQFNPIFTNSTMMTSSAQGGSMSGYPLGWDLATGLGMTPGSFNSSTMGQNSASASQPMSQQQNASISQPMAQNVSVSQPMGQINASASQPMAQQQNLVSLIQPISPT